jgi:hypothetical protein
MRRQTVIIMISRGDNFSHFPFFHFRGSRSMRWGGMMFCKKIKIMRPDVLNCLDVWTSPYCMFDARHVDLRHTTSSSDMSYAVCRMSYVVCRMSYVVCRMSYVVCRMSYVKCQMSNVKCQMSNVKCQMSNVKCQMSNVKCQMSNVVCRMSYVVCRMSHVVCRMSHVACPCPR